MLATAEPAAAARDSPRVSTPKSLVADAVEPGGRVFFVDNRVSSGARARPARALRFDTRIETRELNDGREYEIIKTFHEPALLQQRLLRLCFRFDIRETATHFIYGIGERQLEGRE